MISRLLNWVEKAGNRLPDPLTLFVLMALAVLAGSALAAWAGVSAIHPVSGEAVGVNNLFAKEYVVRMFTQMPATFTGFAPLGLVLVVMLGIGVADKAGLVRAALALFVRRMPPSVLSGALVFAGVMSSLAADAGFIVLVPLGAVVFLSVGRHPLAGLAAVYAGVAGGFSANLLITGLDAAIASFTEPAAHLLDPAYQMNVAANYYLMVVLTPVLSLAGWYVTDKIVEPRLGKYDGPQATPQPEDSDAAAQTRALRRAGWSLLFMSALIALMVVPENAVLRDPSAPISITPFLQSIVPLIMMVFLVAGIVYGVSLGTIRNDRDVAHMMAESMASMGSYIVLAFAAAHFVAFFGWSNLGLITAIKGAGFLRDLGFTGLPLLIALVVMAGILNLFIGSASAKWALMAPIFVPMFMLLGLSPELTQAAYRLGDAFTNPVTPLLPYFPIAVVFARVYRNDVGLGTLISIMLPYTVVFFVLSVIVLSLWYLLGIPVGPDSPLFYSPR